MKQTKFTRVAHAIANTERGVRSLAMCNDLPSTFKQRLVQLAEELKGHELDQYREPLVGLIGDVFTMDEVKAMIAAASGFIKWKGEELTEEEGVAAEVFRDQFGLDVKDGDVKVYNFTRDVRNRDLVYYITVSCIPGLTYVSYQTDRVGIGSEDPIPNQNVPKYLKRDVFDE